MYTHLGGGKPASTNMQPGATNWTVLSTRHFVIRFAQPMSTMAKESLGDRVESDPLLAWKIGRCSEYTVALK
jgi:hypothetical protein